MKSLFVVAVVGCLFLVGLFGMGGWLRNAAEGAGNYWLRWWVVIAVIFGGGALQEVSFVLYGGSWLVFVVIGFSRLLEKHLSSWEKARKIGLGVLSLPTIALGAWVLDPYTGWFVTGHGLADYWRGRGGEAAIYLGVLALVSGIVALTWVFKTAGQALGRSNREE